jgi:hypothetical protein
MEKRKFSISTSRYSDQSSRVKDPTSSISPSNAQSLENPKLPHDMMDELEYKQLLEIGEWEPVRAKLPRWLEMNIKFNPSPPGSRGMGTWTYVPGSEEIPFGHCIPLKIAGAPVIIPAKVEYPLLSSNTSPPPDHYPAVDPFQGLDDNFIKTFQNVYGFALGAYVFISGEIQVIVPSDFNVNCKFLHIHQTCIKISSTQDTENIRTPLF